MILYIDTSSIVKLVIEEEGSVETRALVSTAELVWSSLIAYPEARAALSRAHRSGRLMASPYELAVKEFEAIWRGMAIVYIEARLARHAGDLADRHGLRGFDAVHLSSALAVRRDTGDPVSFSTWDDALMTAAVAEGLG